ncbi:MAG: AraC family transcriptional regulator [Prevotella sp.]|nr:AraC family transcriptional regulator [Prevotella sp.]
MNKLNIVHALGDEVLFVDNLREVENLSTLRMEYNTITYCRGGRILVEVGGNNQVKVGAGQLLLIPAGKLVQPMLISTDVKAGALMVSERLLKSVLGNQVNIWNKAMYMKEIYVIEEAGWLSGLQSYAQTIFKGSTTPVLFREMVVSFLRTMVLLVCEELLRHEDMSSADDVSTTHDKELFNRFLQLLSEQEQKRQRVTYYAEQLNITSKYLSAISKKVSGKSPMRWITESVMQDCYSLLRDSDLTVKEISNRLGFPNSSFFGQYFREEAGVTPVEYRNDHKRIV